MQKIPRDQILNRIRSENSWWDKTPSIPDIYSGFKPRSYLKLFYPLLVKRDPHRAVVLMGPRRVGKTVMIHHAVERLLKDGVHPLHICYFSVDHPIYTGLGLEDLIESYQESTGIDYKKVDCFVFFDEIQYLKDWEVHLKILVDRYKSIKCVVSGSAAAALRLRSIESGAGRFTNFLLPPLTFHEYLELLDKEHLIEPIEDLSGFYETTNIKQLNSSFVHYLNYGGYPEVIFSKEIQADPSRFIKSDIVDKVLLRDLPGLYGIQDIQELNYLFSTLAFNTANEVSLEELSQGSGVAKNTIKKYIEYLEAAFLIKIIHRVDRNAKRFKRANFFKVYLTNPSIRSALFTPVQEGDDFIGHLAETAIFSQWFHQDSPLHYARWKGGEVDIVSMHTNKDISWAVEVKYSDRFYDRPYDLKSIFKFCTTNNLRSVTITTHKKSGIKLINNVELEFIPSSLYCYTVGRNLIEGKKETKRKIFQK